MVKKMLVVLVILSIAVPCFADIVDTAWVRRYNGPANDYDEAVALAVDDSGNVYVTGSSRDSETYSDYTTIKYYPNGDTTWLRRYSSPGYNYDKAHALALDDSGNVYVTGECFGTLYDYVTIKYYSNGDTAWVREYNGPGNNSDEAYAITVDDSGNVYVSGYSIGSGTYRDYATIKYYSNGDTAWVRRYNGSANSDDWVMGIAVDDSGNVYVTGFSEETGTYRDYTTIKYHSNGDTAWVRSYNGPGDSTDIASAIAVDDSGYVYVTGESYASGSNTDYATVKYHPNGDTVWVRRYSGPGNDYDETYALAVDNSGNVYVTGASTGSGTSRDYATIKYYPNGDTAWVKRYNGPGNSSDWAYDLAVDNSGNVYVTGGSVGSGTSNDCATIKYYPDGDTAWVIRYNGPDSGSDKAYAITVDNSWNTWITGYSTGSGTSLDYTTIKYTTYFQDPNDPGAADTLYFQAGSPCSSNGDTLYFPPGGGDVTIYINVWNDEALAALTVPLVDSAYSPPSYAFLDSAKNNGAPDPLCFQGSRVEHFDKSCYLEYNPPQVLYGVFSVFDSLSPGDGLFAKMVYTVSDTGRICLDTLFHPPSNFLQFVRTTTESFIPQFVSKCFYLRPYPPPIPDFVGNPVIGEKNLEVSFTNLTEGDVTSWYWSFGDGYMSVEQNPTHTYKEAGSYSVKLIASNAYTSDSLIKENYIQVLGKPQADFTAEPTVGSPPLGVQFSDNSIGNVTSWKWYFGDDDSSSLEDPYHEYSSFGTYDVTLIATSANGSDTLTKENFIFAYPALSGDSVKVLNITALPNQEDVVVPIVQSNADTLSQIFVPLAFDPEKIQLDSASFVGSRVENFEILIDSISNEEGYLLLACLVLGPDSYLTTGQGLLANLYLKVKDVVPPDQMIFDTTTVTIGETEYVLQYTEYYLAEPYYPDFAPGSLYVGKTDYTPPETPQNLVALPLESSVSLTWDAVTDPDLRLYAIYRNTSVFTPGSLDDTLATSLEPLYLDSDVSSGETYFYRVSAVDSCWNESEYSDTASAAFGDITPPVITLGPTVIAISDTMATIYWETDEEADGCVELFEDAEWVPADSHTQFLEEHTITLIGLISSESYEYRVRSDDSLGNGPTYSDPDTFTTASGPDETPPQIIFGPAVVYLTHNSATIGWTTDEIADGRVYYGETTPFPDSAVDPSFVTGHSIALTGLSSSTEYFYVVNSEDPSSNGPVQSDTLSFITETTPDETAPAIVAGPIHSGITDNKAVISWVTDEISTSILQYGPSELYGSERVKSDYVQNHQVVLTNLEDSTLYHYRVGSVDPESNGPVWSSDFWFWTHSEPDTIPPLILTGPYASWINNTQVQIDWTTDEISDSRVFYGLGGSYDKTAGSPIYVTAHSVVLTNLVSGTTYNFYVSSTDPSSNTVESEHSVGPIKPLDIGENQFTTKASADATPPVIISGPYVRHKTHNQAVVEWITDETGNSIVEYGEDQNYGTTITYPEAKINHTAHLSNLNPSTTYHFRVGSVDMAKNGPAYSTDVTFITLPDAADTDPPMIMVPPVVAYLDETRAIITWETDEPADSYMGYELIGGLAEHIVGESFSNFNHMLNMSLASSYNVRVFSTDPYGNGPTYSDYFTVTAPTSPDVEVPVVTYGPEVVYLSANSAKIMWETDELSSSFVEYGLSEEYTDFEANPDNDSLHEVTLTNLSASTTYHYRIKSADLFANIYLGSDSTFTTEGSSDIIPPAAPTGFLTSYGNQSITLFWEENSESDLSGYNLHRGTSIDDSLPLLASNLPHTSYKDNGLVNGVVYYYQIVAVDQSSNESPFSEVICSKPLPYILGDYNDDETIDVVDVVAIINYLFRGAEGHEPVEAGNVNCDLDVTIADVVYLINYQFKAGPDPCLCTIPEEPLARYGQRANAILGLSFPVEDQHEEIEVLLEAEVEEEIAGLQVDLVFDPSMLEIKEIKTTERTDNLGLYYHTQAGKVKIGMVDIYGVHTVEPEEGSLLKITFYKKRKQAGISDAKIENAILVNTMADELDVEIKHNKVIKTIPQTFSLAQNYPNPFNARTVIMYSLPKDSKVEITVYNILGQRVKTLLNEHQQAGYKSIVWDGTNQKGKEVASGVYFYKIKADDFTSSKKMLLLK